MKIIRLMVLGGLLAGLVGFGVWQFGFSQEKIPALTEVERLKGEKIQAQMTTLQVQFRYLSDELEKVAQDALKERKLDPAKFRVNWQTFQIAPVLEEKK